LRLLGVASVKEFSKVLVTGGARDNNPSLTFSRFRMRRSE